jgi:ABC-type Mn2+/Zn2+ transport system ATPase subunit
MVQSNQSVIRCREAAMGYGHLRVLEEVNLDLGLGSYVGIVGPNGAGKTTLLKALTGILSPQSGTIEVDRHPTADRPLVFGYVAQSNTLDDSYPLSALDVTLMGRIGRVGPFRRFRPQDVEAALQALRRVELEDRAQWSYSELSRGQQQRVLLARALAGEPDILCLDEPTNFLDPSAQVAFLNTVDDLRHETGMTVLIVTHLLQSVADHAQEVWLVQGGRIRVLSDQSLIKGELANILEGRNGVREEALAR